MPSSSQLLSATKIAAGVRKTRGNHFRECSSDASEKENVLFDFDEDDVSSIKAEDEDHSYEKTNKSKDTNHGRHKTARKKGYYNYIKNGVAFFPKIVLQSIEVIADGFCSSQNMGGMENSGTERRMQAARDGEDDFLSESNDDYTYRNKSDSLNTTQSTVEDSFELAEELRWRQLTSRPKGKHTLPSNASWDFSIFSSETPVINNGFNRLPNVTDRVKAKENGQAKPLPPTRQRQRQDGSSCLDEPQRDAVHNDGATTTAPKVNLKVDNATLELQEELCWAASKRRMLTHDIVPVSLDECGLLAGKLGDTGYENDIFLSLTECTTDKNKGDLCTSRIETSVAITGEAEDCVDVVWKGTSTGESHRETRPVENEQDSNADVEQYDRSVPGTLLHRQTDADDDGISSCSECSSEFSKADDELEAMFIAWDSELNDHCNDHSVASFSDSTSSGLEASTYDDTNGRNDTWI